MQWVSAWGAWLAVAALPGVLNIFVAIDELLKECRRLPFFQPQLSPGFWLWAFFQFTIPAGLFWLLTGLQNRPVVDLTLWGQALGFGLGFVVVLNSRTDISSLPTVDIKQLYNLLIKYARNQIATRQTGKTARFWADLTDDLKQSTADFDSGFQYLALYFDEDVSLTAEEKQRYQERIKLAQAEVPRAQQVKAIRNLLEVRRRDLPEALRRFGGSESLVQRYFPRSTKTESQKAPRA
jgi:hypothetical protein